MENNEEIIKEIKKTRALIILLTIYFVFVTAMFSIQTDRHVSKEIRKHCGEVRDEK